MKQLKYLFLLVLSITSFSCTHMHNISVIARITIANEKGVPFKFKDASRFMIRPVGKYSDGENGVFRDVDGLVYEHIFGNQEVVRIYTTRVEREEKLLDEIKGGAGIRIIDLNGEYKEKIHYLYTATFSGSLTKVQTYEAYDIVVLEKK